MGDTFDQGKRSSKLFCIVLLAFLLLRPVLGATDTMGASKETRRASNARAAKKQIGRSARTQYNATKQKHQSKASKEKRGSKGKAKVAKHRRLTKSKPKRAARSPKKSAKKATRQLSRPAMSEANLSMEIFPLYYMPINRSSSFRLAFMSNALRRREINFEIYYPLSKYINFYFNPTKIRLNLWGNVYWMNYQNLKPIDEHDVMRSLEYQHVRIINVLKKWPVIHTTQQNMVFLDPHSRFSFTPDNIKRLLEAGSRVICKHKIVRFKGYKRLMKLRERQRRDKEWAQALQDGDKKSSKKTKKSRRLKQTKQKAGKKTKKTKKKKKKAKKVSLMDEIVQGRHAMRSLYRKNFIKEIILLCDIN